MYYTALGHGTSYSDPTLDPLLCVLQFVWNSSKAQNRNLCSSKGRVNDQRYILRVRRPSTAAYPACWAMGTRREQPSQNKVFLYRYGKPNEPTKEGSLSIVLFESPFTSVFNSQQGPPLSNSLSFTDTTTQHNQISIAQITRNLNSTLKFLSG